MIKRFFDDRRVVEPDDDSARVAVGHFGDEQIGAGLLQRRGDGDPAIKVIGPRLQLQIPRGDLFAQVLIFVAFDDPPADVRDIEFLIVGLARAVLDVALDVIEQLFDFDRMGLEARLRTVAKGEIDRRPFARRLRHDRLETAPIPHDLVEPLLAVVVRLPARIP